MVYETLKKEINDKLGKEALAMLLYYEQAYPPDLALEAKEENGGVLDFMIEGGDISIAGFRLGNHLRNIVWRATQDLLLRLLVAKGDTILIPDLGNGNIMNVPRDLIPAVVAIAVSESPFIDELIDVSIYDVGDIGDAITVKITALTITGDNLTLPVTIGNL